MKNPPNRIFISGTIRKFMRLTSPCFLCIILALCVTSQVMAAAPDLTAGGTPNDNDQWNLGPTGMAGWCYRNGLNTSNARQFLVRTVEPGSPAAGIIAVNDVILGASGTGVDPVNFTQDARIAFAQAITDAEERSPATLKILRWRAGVTSTVSLALETMGAYSATAPYNCPKSAAILEKGIQNMMNTGANDNNWRYSALTLLASNNPANPNNAVRQAKAAIEMRGLILPPETIARYTNGKSMGKDAKPWHIGPKLIALSEYHLKTGDPDVLPSIRAYAHCAANGQSMFGTSGHFFADPGFRNAPVNGPYNIGYGPINNAAIPCYIGLILANKCGLNDPEILAGIERAGTFYAQYTHLGCAGYGEHLAYEGHDTNGKAGLQALAFQLEGDRLESTRYYAKASTAAAIAERDTGHTGSFFAFLYAPLGANVGGPDAMAYYFRETKWMYELARKWDGGFVYNSFASGGVEEGDLVGQGGCLMSTAMLMTYAMPLRQTYLTGKDQNPANWITPAEMPEVQAASAHIYNAPSRTTAELLSDLSVWSPKVRRYAARELKLRTADKAAILAYVHASAADESASFYARAGACAAMGEIGDTNSVPVLLPLVTNSNFVVRYSAANSLASYRYSGNGVALKPHATALMQACVTNHRSLLPLDPVDPMQVVNGNLCHALFAPHAGLHSHDLVGLDRQLLYAAMRICASNAQADVRKGLSTVYPKLTQTDIEQVGDALVNIAYENAPAGMGIIESRLPALSFMQSNGKAEGVPLAIRFAEDLGYKSGNIVDVIKVLANYAASNNTVTPYPDVEHFCEVLIASGAQYGIPEAQATLDAIAADTNPKVLKPFKRIDWVIPDDPTLNLPKNWTTLRVSSTNFSSPASVYTWRKLSGAGSVSFSPNGTDAAKNTIVVFDGTPGQYLFEVNMSDPHALTEVTKTVAVTLLDSGGNLPTNAPPTANALSITAAQGDPTQIILTGADPEGYLLNYTVTSGPSKGSLSGTAPYLVYTAAANATGSDSIAFQVEDSEGQIATATVNITVNASAPVGLAIYEPFNYPIGNLHGKSGASEIGLTGTWTAGSQITTESPSITYGTLPVIGNKVRSVVVNGPGGSRPISPVALASRGLLDDGATLWFSVEMAGYGGWIGIDGNVIDLALANNSFPYSPNIPNNGMTPGSGLGMRLNNTTVRAAQFFDAAVGAPLTGTWDHTVTGGVLPEQPRIIVGKITWGGASDTVEIYLPKQDMVLPVKPSSVLTANVDQATFNTLTFSRGRNVILDEIRFGATLQSVLQGTVDMSADVTAPSPNPMTFAVAPAPASTSSITMTATPALDGMGVQYYFTCTAGGGNSSGWLDSNVYTDTGLTPGVNYSYTIKARDKHPALNETAASAAFPATIPTLATVPSVQGLPQALGQTLITNASLSVGAVTQSTSYNMTVPAGSIISQSPTAGTSTTYGSSVNLIISIGQNPILPVLSSASIVDDRSGETVELGTPVTYTLTFSKDINAATLDLADFINAGDVPVTISAITEISPGVVTVTLTPDGVLAGNLRFAVAAGAVIKDTSGNDLNTLSAIIDDTVITVIPVQPKTQVFTGNNSTGTIDNWSNALNWNSNSGPVPSGADNVLIPAGKQVLANLASTVTYTGNLTLGVGAHLQAGNGINNLNVYNCLGTPGTTTISMGDGSRISFRDNNSPIMPAILLQGNAEITSGSSSNPGSHPIFNNPINGSYALTISGKSANTTNLNVANNFGHLILSTQYGSLFNVNANTAGALGGDVTVMADYLTGGKGANLIFNAANAMSDIATLTLFGNTGNLVTLNFNDTIGGLKLNGVIQLPGIYHSGNSSWIAGTGTLTVNGPTMAYWNSIGGPAGIWDDSNIWNTQSDLAGTDNPWAPGQMAAFNASGTYGVTLNGTKEIGGLVVSNGSVTLANGELSLSDQAVVSIGSAASLTLGAVVSQNFDGLGLHKSGAGTLILSSENTFTGPVAIGGGILSIATIDNAGAPSALGQYPDSGIGGLYLAGGTLRYTGGSSTVNRGFTFGGSSSIDISNIGSALTLGDVETSGPGTLNVTGGAGSTLGLGNIKIVQSNNIALNPNNVSMSVASIEGYNNYPLNATITLGGNSPGNVVTGNIYASAYPGSAYQQGTSVVKTGTGEWRLAGAFTAGPVGNHNITVHAGTLILSGNNTFNGHTSINHTGKMVFDYSTNDTNKAAGQLLFTGGTLELKGGSHLEVVTSTTLNAGLTSLITRDGGTAKLRMNAITRNAQSSIAFLDSTVADTDRTNTNGILGGYATIGKDWAVNSTNGADGPITPLSSYNTWSSTGGSSTANYLLNGSSSLTGNLVANSLKIVNTDVNQTLNLGSNNLTVTSNAATTLGGVLYAAGANNQYTINGTGAILASTTTGELIVHTAQGSLTVNTPVVTSGATAGLLTKTGSGSLILAGSNVYTGATRVSNGKLFINGSLSNVGVNLIVDSGAALGGSGTVGRNITIADGGGLEFTLGTPSASHTPLTRSSGRTFTFAESSILTITAGANAAPGTYTLITGGNNITGTAPTQVILPPGWTADAPFISGAQLRINITNVVNPPANAAPVWAVDPVNEVNATEDAPYNSTIFDGATDPNNDALTFLKVSGPAWLNIATDGTLSGTPSNSDVGPNTFTVSVSDGIASAVEATLNITVINTNDAPVWSSNPLIGPDATEDAMYSQDITTTVTDLDTGAVLAFAKVNGPSWLDVASNGIISGTPNNSDVGLNTFTVSVSDGIAAAVEVTLNIIVINTNDAPFWSIDPISGGNIVRDSPYTHNIASLAGDVDPGASLTFSLLSGPAWLSVAANGALSGIPATSNIGMNVFTVGVSDNIAPIASATFNINVVNSNVAPVAQPQSVSTDEDTALPITLVATDADANPLTYSILGQPANGTLSGTLPNLTYTPSANYHGTDSFTFKVNDTVVDSNIATIAITINSINDAPAFTTDPVVLDAITETVSYTGQTLAGRATDVDAGDTLTYLKISGPSWLTVDTNGALSGTPPLDSTGLNSFIVRATDSASATVDATLQIAVNIYALTWDANGPAAGQTNGAGAWLNDFVWWEGALNSNVNILNSGSNKWVSGANATFGGQSTNGGAVTLASPTSAKFLTFDTFTGTYTLGTAGQTLTITGGINKTSDSGIVSIISPLILGTNQTWTNNSANSMTASAALGLGPSTMTLDGTGTTSLTGVISGSGNIVKNGLGRLTFNTSNANTYTGTTTINDGVLMIGTHAASLGSGNVTLNGGILEAYWTTSLTRALGAGNGELQLTGGISGFGQNGLAQTLTVNFGNNAANEATWGTASFNPSVLAFHHLSYQGSGAIVLQNRLDLNGATRTIHVHGGATGAASATISGVLRSSSGTAGLVKTGSGILTLSASNTYTGATTISGGTLRIGNDTAASLGGGNYAGNISIASGSSLQIWSSAAQTLSGIISGAGNLHKAHGGTLTLSGPHTYTGKTSFLPQSNTGFTVNVSSFNSVNGGSPTLSSSSLGSPTTIDNGTIDIGSPTQQAGVNLTYTGPGESTDRVLNFGFTGTASQTLTASGTGPLTFTSAMTANAITTQTGALILSGTGAGAITQTLPTLPAAGVSKTGTGSWILSGTNSYTGPTAVTAGKLFINGNQTAAAGNTSVSANATLGGTGTIGGNTVIAANGRLEFDLSTPAASHNPLELATAKTLSFSGTSTLNITATTNGAEPGTYVLVTAPGGITGSAPTTLNLPIGWVASVTISGNNLLLTVNSVLSGTPGSLAVANTSGLSSTGSVGGPFAPASIQYTLSNPGDYPINWTAAKNVAWLDLSATSGTLVGGASTTLTVSINSGANSLNIASYNETVNFANTSNGNGNTTRSVSLTVDAPRNYTVSYNGNGNTGGIAPPEQTKTHGLGLTLLNSGTLVRSAHTFSGWNTAADGSGNNYPAGATYSVNADVTLYAQWTAASYTVIFDANGGDTPSPTTKEVTFGSTYGSLATATRAGYIFNGWFTAASAGTQVTAATSVAATANHTLYAQWSVGVFLTWDANGTSAGQTNGPGAWLGTNLWWNGAANTNWVSGAAAIFGGAATNGGNLTLASPITVQSLTFNQHNSTYTLGTAGQTITLNDGIHKTSTSSTLSIISPLTLAANQVWANHSSGTLTVTGIIGGAGGITKTGSGTVILNAPNDANNYTGNTKVLSGILQLGTAWSSANNLPGGLTGTTGTGQSNLEINGGTVTIWLDMTRTLGTGSHQIHITGGRSGFTNKQSDNLAGNLKIGNDATNEIVWGSDSFKPSTFVLQDAAAVPGTAVFNLDNKIDLNGADRTVEVGASSATLSQMIRNSIGTAGLIKSGAGTLILSATNTYNGNTTVSAGTLRINVANANNQSSTVSIAAGATLHLGFTGTDTVDKLFVDGAQLAAGTYKAVGSLASGTDLSVLAGTGTLTVLSGFTVGSLYEVWASVEGLVDGDALSAADPDGDSLTNLQEYAFGMDPESGTLASLTYVANSTTTPGLPILENTGTQGAPIYRAVFGRRKDHIAASLAYQVQFSANLIYWKASNTGITVLTGPSPSDIEAVAVPFPSNVPLSGAETEHAPPRFFRVVVSNH